MLEYHEKNIFFLSKSSRKYCSFTTMFNKYSHPTLSLCVSSAQSPALLSTWPVHWTALLAVASCPGPPAPTLCLTMGGPCKAWSWWLPAIPSPPPASSVACPAARSTTSLCLLLMELAVAPTAPPSDRIQVINCHWPCLTSQSYSVSSEFRSSVLFFPVLPFSLFPLFSVPVKDHPVKDIWALILT